ncbi:hypothetical protein C4K38_0998 [Pseudomonas chlororaphis subsp. piscium]|nr:hypothetical protein C4K38_0998 [Pseudomonas chlororaphis subsp. piscium]
MSGTRLAVTINTAEAEWCAIRQGDDRGVTMWRGALAPGVYRPRSQNGGR